MYVGMFGSDSSVPTCQLEMLKISDILSEGRPRSTTGFNVVCW